MSKAKFISIEGIEGAGKSTVIDFIKSFLQNVGIDHYLTREPGGTPLAETLREILLYPETNEVIEPTTELLLMFAGREQHIKQRILPNLQEGRWVVSDRYVDASYAYQGGGRNMDVRLISYLDKYVVGHVYPDITLLLDVTPEMGFTRTAKRSTDKDRIEQEQVDFFHRVRDVYLERAAQDPARIKIINASLALPEVEKQIAVVLNELIASVTE